MDPDVWFRHQHVLLLVLVVLWTFSGNKPVARLALFFVLSGPSPLCLGEELELFWSCDVGETNIDQIQFMFGIVSFKSLKTINSYDSNSIKSLHSSFIKELYRGRKAPVIPFKEESVLATCYNILDKSIKSEFLKEWGLKSCIYLIAYKHDPLIYYIGRTNLFKRRLNNHLKAETNNKFHMFLNLVGWEHFNVSILEVCSLHNQGERENYYLQKYLPLLNSVFSSSIIESSIQITLKDKLNALRTPKSTLSSKNIPDPHGSVRVGVKNKKYQLPLNVKTHSQGLVMTIGKSNLTTYSSLPVTKPILKKIFILRTLRLYIRR